MQWMQLWMQCAYDVYRVNLFKLRARLDRTEFYCNGILKRIEHRGEEWLAQTQEKRGGGIYQKARNRKQKLETKYSRRPRLK